MSDIRARLLTKRRKTHASMKIDLGDATVEVDIKRPTNGDRVRLIDRAIQSGQLSAEGTPTSPLNGMKFMASVICHFVYVNEVAVFTPDDVEAVIDMPCFDELSKVMQEAFSPTLESVEGK